MYITSCPYFMIVSTDISSTTWGTPEEDPVPYRGWWRWRWPSPDHYTVQCPGQVCVGSGINLYVMWRISWECYFTKENLQSFHYVQITFIKKWNIQYDLKLMVVDVIFIDCMFFFTHRMCVRAVEALVGGRRGSWLCVPSVVSATTHTVPVSRSEPILVVDWVELKSIHCLDL